MQYFISQLQSWFSVVFSLALLFYAVRFVLRKEVIACCGEYSLLFEFFHVLMFVAMLDMLGLSTGVSVALWTTLMLGICTFYIGYAFTVDDAKKRMNAHLHASMFFGMWFMFSVMKIPSFVYSNEYVALELLLYIPLAVFYGYWVVRGAIAAYQIRKLYLLAWGQDVFHFLMCTSMILMVYQSTVGTICHSG